MSKTKRLPPVPMSVYPDIRQYKVPSIEVMLRRAGWAKGTCFERWALDALMLRCLLAQAMNLDRISELSYDEPRRAMDLAGDNHGRTHPDLYWLRTAIFLQAVGHWKEVEGLNQPAPPPKKRRKKGEGLTAPTVSPSIETRSAPTEQAS